MGRQIALVATLEDERRFLEFLRQTADVVLFEGSAPSVALIEVSEFAAELPHHYQYFIWNRAFLWQPEFGRVDHPKAPAASRGHAFIANTSTAPLLEYDRAVPNPRRPGRLYWSKHFGAPDGVLYDVDAFSKWYDKVVGWVRKIGTKSMFGHAPAYLLPDALHQYGDAAKP